MTDLSRWPEADALLDHALELDEDERRRWLAELAARDPELAQALERTLRDGLDDSFLPSGGAARLLADLAERVDADARMPRLEPGAMFGPYRIDSLIGRGGMGEVYRARDQRLARDVAIKVLPARWTDDVERRARFEREARLLASLRHAGIAAIHHLEEHEGVMALVLELVEGPTLEQRLRGGPLPVAEAIALARSLVEALDAAHQQGVVHRDLKPANVKLPPEGGVKVLDFGLARAFAGADGRPDTAGLTSRHGLPARLLGTPAYMSPEQARGERVDARCDIWAFGCVLYEMLTGRRAFGGHSTSEVFEQVATRDPDETAFPAAVPDPLRRLVSHCLCKDPRDRLGYIGDALDDLAAAETAPARNGPHRRPARGLWRPALAGAAAAGLLVGGLIAGAWIWTALTRGPEPVRLRLAMPLPAGDRFVPSQLPVLAVSPGDATIVYRARRAGVTQLFARALDAEAPVPLPGTENATGPFFSPDGQWIAFDRDGVLSRMPITGATPPVAVCPAPGGVTGTWAEDGRIVFAAGTARVLQEVAVEGGSPTAVTRLTTDAGEVAHGMPIHVPGTPWVIFTVHTTGEPQLARLDLRTREVSRIGEGKQAQYMASGHLAFVRRGAIWTAPFDPRAGVLTGQPVPAVPDVLDGTGATSGAQFAVSTAGTLVYLTNRGEASVRALVWLSPTGRAEDVPVEPRALTRASISPDGRRVAVAVAEPGAQDVWVLDLASGEWRRVTTDRGLETAPIWLPDGRGLVYRTDRDGGGLFLEDLTSAAPVRRLTRPDGPIHTPYDVTSDGRFVLYTEFRSYRDQDIAMVEIATGAVTPLVTDAGADVRPQLSPDGRLLAYQSDASGRFEVYLRRFGDPRAERLQVSSDGGTSPVWRGNGELLYDDGSGISAVTVAMSPGPRVGRPRRLFDAPDIVRDRLGPILDVHPDGRLLSISAPRGGPPPPSPVLIARGWLPPGEASRGR